MALRQAGADVTAFERAPELQPVRQSEPVAECGPRPPQLEVADPIESADIRLGTAGLWRWHGTPLAHDCRRGDSMIAPPGRWSFHRAPNCQMALPREIRFHSGEPVSNNEKPLLRTHGLSRHAPKRTRTSTPVIPDQALTW